MNVIKILRSATGGSVPTGKTEGEPFFNEADKSFGVVDAAGVSQQLVAVRFFSALAAYIVGDHVIQAGGLYRCTTAIPVPGAFDPLDWAGVGAVDLSPYLLLAGGTMTGEIILPGVPTDPLAATDKTYVDQADTVLQDQIDVIEGGLLFVGSIDVVTDAAIFSVSSGGTDGPLPAAAAANKGWYLINTVAGAALAGNIPAGNYAVGDWVASDGTGWLQLPLGQAAVTAPQVAMSPVVGMLGADVQLAITALEANKMELDAIIDAGAF